jgi:shikimate kinase
MKMYNKVSEWIDGVLSDGVPDEAVAFCFNLYENDEYYWSMELIGAGRFDPDDQDWACDEVTDFNSRESLFTFQAECEWDEALQTMIDILKKYLNDGKYADLLKSREGVGVGFVDGDIEIIYISK